MIIKNEIEENNLKNANSNKNSKKEVNTTYSDISKDYKELNNEINRVVESNVSAISGISGVSIGISSNENGILFNDNTWKNNKQNFDNSDNFNQKVNYVIKDKENKIKFNELSNKKKEIRKIVNPNKQSNFIVEQMLKTKKEIDESNVDDCDAEERFPVENLNQISEEKLKPKFILDSTKINPGKTMIYPNSTSNNFKKKVEFKTPDFKINAINDENDENKKTKWINYPSRKLLFATGFDSHADKDSEFKKENKENSCIVDNKLININKLNLGTLINSNENNKKTLNNCLQNYFLGTSNANDSGNFNNLSNLSNSFLHYNKDDSNNSIVGYSVGIDKTQEKKIGNKFSFGCTQDFNEFIKNKQSLENSQEQDINNSFRTYNEKESHPLITMMRKMNDDFSKISSNASSSKNINKSMNSSQAINPFIKTSSFYNCNNGTNNKNGNYNPYNMNVNVNNNQNFNKFDSQKLLQSKVNNSYDREFTNNSINNSQNISSNNISLIDIKEKDKKEENITNSNEKKERSIYEDNFQKEEKNMTDYSNMNNFIQNNFSSFLFYQYMILKQNPNLNNQAIINQISILEHMIIQNPQNFQQFHNSNFNLDTQGINTNIQENQLKPNEANMNYFYSNTTNDKRFKKKGKRDDFPGAIKYNSFNLNIENVSKNILILDYQRK